VHIEATCKALWEKVMEIAIIIIIVLDVQIFMDKRHHLLVAFQ
jgi:hypothetical protein